LRKWRSASELKFDLPAPPEVRRISEWPTGYPVGTYRLSRIDPFSITISRPNYAGTDQVGEPVDEYINEGPASHWNVLACGLGAPIVAEMLRVGSHLAGRRCPGFGDLIILTEIHPELNLPWDSAFPAGLDPEKLARVLLDPETILHAIVSYDVDSKPAAEELKRFREVRDVFRPECPLVVLTRFPNVQVALGEFRSIVARRSGIVQEAAHLYHEVRNAIVTQEDSDPSGYL